MSGYGSRAWQSGAACVCGCGERAVQRHHAIYVQELRRVAGPRSVEREMQLISDARNLLPIAHRCHERHHTRFGVLPLTVLPDSVFEFAVEVLGAGAAYEYLRRHYAGDDARLRALMAEAA